MGQLPQPPQPPLAPQGNGPAASNAGPVGGQAPPAQQGATDLKAIHARLLEAELEHAVQFPSCKLDDVVNVIYGAWANRKLQKNIEKAFERYCTGQVMPRALKPRIEAVVKGLMDSSN